MNNLQIWPPPVQTPYQQGIFFSGPWVKWFQSLAIIINTLTGLSGSGTSLNLPVGLGKNSTGLLFDVTDYNHVLQWNGTGWQWGPGENGSGYIVAFVNPPNPLTGWHVCDGSTVSQLNADGSVSTVTIPTIAGSYFRQ